MKGAKLKALRKERKMTQAQLALMLDVDITLIGKWELYDVTPNPDTLNKLSSIFDVTTDYLLGRSDIPNPQPQTKKEAFIEGLKELKLEQYKELTEADKALIAQQFNGLIDRLQKK